MRVFAVSLDKTLTIPDGVVDWKNAQEVFSIEPNLEAIEEMQKWVMDLKMVPSILTDRIVETRVVTEAWMAKHNVPYSNFLLEVKAFQMPDILRHIDASFFLSNNEFELVEVANNEAVLHTGLRVYSMLDDSDFDFLIYNKRPSNKKCFSKIEAFSEITEREA